MAKENLIFKKLKSEWEKYKLKILLEKLNEIFVYSLATKLK